MSPLIQHSITTAQLKIVVSIQHTSRWQMPFVTTVPSNVGVLVYSQILFHRNRKEAKKLFLFTNNIGLDTSTNFYQHKLKTGKGKTI